MTQSNLRNLDWTQFPSALREPRILLVDDHPLMRRAVKGIIEREWANGVCGEAGDEATAMEQFRSTRPNLVLLDLCLGDRSGLDVLRWMLKVEPGIRVLVLSMYEESQYAERVIRAGGRGYVHKGETPETIVAAIRSVLGGNVYLNPSITGRILQNLTAGRRHREDIEALSDREIETFEAIGVGLGSREIARRLCVSVKTVEAYRQRIKGKLGISTSPELARRAVEWVLLNTNGRGRVAEEEATTVVQESGGSGGA